MHELVLDVLRGPVVLDRRESVGQSITFSIYLQEPIGKPL